MNILMMTNTYLPHVGGVARSVAWFTRQLRDWGHRVVVVAPEFDADAVDDTDVIRVPAIQNFNGSDFSVRLPIPGLFKRILDTFEPDIVHSHHPFLLGDTALQVATSRGLPIVFTHHTMYERYTHYVPGDSTTMQRFVIRMATEYANLCDHVIAPSESIADVLRDRGVSTPITPIPTGIDPDRFATGDGDAARKRASIPAEAFVVGHVGRLAPEKNLAFLARAIARFVADTPDAHALIVGSGPSEPTIREVFDDAGLRDRLHMPGSLDGAALTDAYHAMDVFAFASQSETQGMVLAEAATAGVPLVAVDAPGAREVVSDGDNGRLLDDEDEGAFADALRWLHTMSDDDRAALRDRVRASAEPFTMQRCAERLAAVYEHVIAHNASSRELDDTEWAGLLRRIEAQWDLWAGRAEAAVDAITETDTPGE